MFTTVVQQIAHHAENQDRSVQVCTTRTQVINLALLPEAHTPQIRIPTSFYLKVMQALCLLRTATLKI